MTNTKKMSPTESATDSVKPDPEKELIDTIDAKELKGDEALAKGGTRGGIVADDTGVA